ncbi:hypothetical protein [Erwinia phage vB_Ea277G]|nr:hypothetical protein [Erwinia phage vB_Ea277G]
MIKTNESFPVDDKGKEADLVVSTAGMVFPFWGIRTGWAGAVEGGEYLMLAMDTKELPEGVTPVPDKSPMMVFYPNRKLDLTHWALVAAQVRHGGHTPMVIRVLWNTGEEFQYENVLKNEGKRTLSYKGNVSSGVNAQ